MRYGNYRVPPLTVWVHCANAGCERCGEIYEVPAIQEHGRVECLFDGDETCPGCGETRKVER